VLAKPAWQSPGTISLARSIYDLNAFDRLTQLANALEEAGCDEPSIIDHWRIPGLHVLGCWVVDLVLGYEP
jgi:alkanesulfonate monooxygenase SsuD/methylene tetrahydromethanopterin reductase-like flavin-dependent oxidoreductase (luciferase family)